MNETSYCQSHSDGTVCDVILYVFICRRKMGNKEKELKGVENNLENLKGNKKHLRNVYTQVSWTEEQTQKPQYE